MDSKQTLMQYLQSCTTATCLHLLEAALASDRYRADGHIPRELLSDLQDALGEAAVQKEIATVVKMGILEETAVAEGSGIRLAKRAQPILQALLQEIRCGLTLEIGQTSMEAGTYLAQLVQALSAHADCRLNEQGSDSYLLEWEGERYRLVLTLSPFWLPLFTERDEEAEKYIIAFGPFSSQSWEAMYAYCEEEEFRARCVLYDPWSREKMSLCKGALPVYIDWFHRDHDKTRFTIPAALCDTLHSMGLMRYNDER